MPATEVDSDGRQTPAQSHAPAVHAGMGPSCIGPGAWGKGR